MQYSCCYLFLILVVLVGVIVFNILFTSYSTNRLKALETFYLVSEETSHIQQEYTNLLAYNWLKTLSYESNIALNPYANILLNDAVAVFAQSNIVQLIEQSYEKDIALNILNGNAYRFFKN